jgi:hypothetical protein
MTASLGSVTVPVTEPVTVCASAMDVHINTAHASANVILRKMDFIWGLTDIDCCKTGCWKFGVLVSG